MRALLDCFVLALLKVDLAGPFVCKLMVGLVGAVAGPGAPGGGVGGLDGETDDFGLMGPLLVFLIAFRRALCLFPSSTFISFMMA